MIVLVSEDGQVRESIGGVLRPEWSDYYASQSLDVFWKLATKHSFKLLLLDTQFPTDLITFISAIKEKYSSLVIVLLADTHDFDSTIGLIRHGVYDVLSRDPFESELRYLVERIAESEPSTPISRSKTVSTPFHMFFERVIGCMTLEDDMFNWSTFRKWLDHTSRNGTHDDVIQFASSLKDKLDDRMLFNLCVVEDEPELSDVLERLFMRAGFMVTVCDRLDAASEFMATSNSLDAMLLDLGLPDGTGDQLLYSKHAQNVAVVVLTAYQDFELAVKSLQAGAMGYVTKPFNNRDLIFRIRKAILERLCYQFYQSGC